jgi:transcription initiation factor TFIID subunit 7
LQEAAKVLREAIQTGANNLKDRLSIRLENDLRYGEVRFDHWLYHVKVVDLPTVIESLKTIDLKSFYKTADICQMVRFSVKKKININRQQQTFNFTFR